jgi:hypothetical protein
MLRRRLAVLAIVPCLVVGCGGEDAAVGTTAEETTEATDAIAPVSDEAATAFAVWYRAAVREGGDQVPARLQGDDPGAQESMRGFIRIMCATNADDTPSRHAAAEVIKDDPEFFGDAAFAASAIVQARIACGLDE